jgi:hypothetical protein
MQVVEIHFHVAALSMGPGIAKLPLASRMFIRNPAHREIIRLEDPLQPPFQFRPLGLHTLAAYGSDVVQVNIHGEARHIEQEQVQGRATLEDEAIPQEGLAEDPVQEPDQADYLLQGLGTESRGPCLLKQAFP